MSPRPSQNHYYRRTGHVRSVQCPGQFLHHSFEILFRPPALVGRSRAFPRPPFDHKHQEKNGGEDRKLKQTDLGYVQKL